MYTYLSKMSFFNSIEQAVTQLKSSIGTELDSTERLLGIMISNVASGVDTEFEKVYAKIRNILDSVGGEVETKMDDVEKLLVEAKNEIEKGADTVYTDFVSKTKDEIAKMKSTSATLVSDMRSAGSYIKNASEKEVKAALDVAANAFETARKDFEHDIATIVDKALDATRRGVQALIDDAKYGTDKLNTLRLEVDSEIKGKFRTIENDLISMKARFSTDMDDIVKFGHTELVKVESRLESASAKAKSITNTIAIASMAIAIAAALGIIFMKERRTALLLEAMKAASLGKPWSK